MGNNDSVFPKWIFYDYPRLVQPIKWLKIVMESSLLANVFYSHRSYVTLFFLLCAVADIWPQSTNKEQILIRERAFMYLFTK